MKIVKRFDTKPKFQGWTKQDYLSANIPFIEPMVCKEFSDKYVSKFDGIPVAQEKLDGHRAICVVTDEGNRFFSRRISKKTEWMAENTDCVPHLRDKQGLPIGTILDGELVHPLGFSSTQSVTGSLPENAIKFQMENGWIEYHVFDILQLGSDNYEQMDYIFRASMLQQCNIFNNVNIYIEDTLGAVADKLYAERNLDVVCVDSFKMLLERMWEVGKEGLIIKDGKSKYEQGKRSSKWLKLKEVIDYDVIICGFQEPTREYDGKTLGDKGYWDYWEDSRGVKFEKRMTVKEAVNLSPVTKPYAKGWIGAIEFGLLRKFGEYGDVELVKIGEAKGISDADQEYIKQHREQLIGTVITIKAQGVINSATNSLRHPRLSRFRNVDKSAESCKWEEFGQ